ncbi:flavin-containing monooxygenase [Saccharothrix stipae]
MTAVPGTADLDVCVVGAGFAGLAVARELHVRAIPFTCLDRGTGIGGVWRYSGTGASPAYPSLRLNTSKHTTAFTWSRMPDDYPTHPRHDQVAAYLDTVAQAFRDRVELGTAVDAVHPGVDGTWTVTTRDRRGRPRYRNFSHVVMATGHHWNPRLPSIPGIATFPGTVVHTLDYRGAEAYAGKRVLVLGLGNSACDVATAVSHVADRTVLAVRRGAHIVPRHLMGIPLDQLNRRWWWAALPARAQSGLVAAVLRATRGPLADHGLPRPRRPVLATPLVVSDDLPGRLRGGAITVKPPISHVDHATVHFTDGTRVDCDAVICCTGYRMGVPVVPREALFRPTGQAALYLRAVPPHHVGLYFAGLVRGVVRPLGALTPVFEAQAAWIADLVLGVAALPDTGTMVAEIDAHLRWAERHHGATAADSLQVDVARYLRALRRARTEGPGSRGGTNRLVLSKRSTR